MRSSDYLSIHCPLTDETRGLCDRRVFSRMKPGSVLINTSRGKVVVEQDLLAALQGGPLAAAGLDVYEQEPPDPAYGWLWRASRSFARVYAPGGAPAIPGHVPHHGMLQWWVKRSFDQLVAESPPAKTRSLSWITSDVRALPGHRRRLRFLRRLRGRVDFDLFGRGFTPLADKWDGLAPYRYSLAVENLSAPHYWTEKVADCFLAWTMPIYCGATNLADYFPAESFVWLDIKDRRAPAGLAEIVSVETVAENFVDGVLSPLFFAALGGAPLAMAFKMVSTLDSMVGYKNERYIDFGKISARLDDILNFIPARLSVPLIALAAQALSRAGGRALHTAWSEGRNHTSPNAGRPEAAFAGALGVRLNGPTTYGGILVKKPFIGVRFREVQVADIKKACDLMMLASLLSVALAAVLAIAAVSG